MTKQKDGHARNELASLTEEAVRLAKQRRERELSEHELLDVQGGLDTGAVLTGYSPVRTIIASFPTE